MTEHNNPSPSLTLLKEQQSMQQFIQTLQQEQALLQASQIDHLPDLLKQKAEIIAAITSATDTRYKALEALSLEASEAGMRAWLASHGTEEDRAAYDELLSVATTAKELNRLNGLLIGKHMSHNQQALDSLHTTLQGGKFYGPDGQSNLKSTGRELGIG